MNTKTNLCETCHPDCKTCDGPYVTECKTCYGDSKLTKDGICTKDEGISFGGLLTTILVSSGAIVAILTLTIVITIIVAKKMIKAKPPAPPRESQKTHIENINKYHHNKNNLNKGLGNKANKEPTKLEEIKLEEEGNDLELSLIHI